ncbi:MAG: ABC transporter substrate-binding protein [Pseudomonadota bacterium]
MKFAHPLWSAVLCATLATSAHAQLRIGQPSGFSGSAAVGVKENTLGAKLYIDSVNRRGGIHGQHIELITLDDKFDPATTAQAGRTLITQHKVLALFLNRGTAHTQALLPVLAELQVPLVAPSTGAMVIHEPVNPWVFNVRATYQREAARAIKHLVSLGITRIAVLQTDDAFGADAAIGAEKGFAAAALQPVLLQKFPREKPDLADLATKVKQSDAGAVLYIGASASVADGVKALRAAGLALQVVTLSNNASEGFIQLLGEQARGVVVAQVFPHERALDYRMVKEAQALAKTKGLSGVSPAMIEGFAAAKVLVEGLRRAGPNPTPRGLRDALENMQKFDLGGLEVSYSATDHTGLDFVDLSIIGANGKFIR